MVNNYYRLEDMFTELKAMYQFQSMQKKVELKLEKKENVPYKLYGDMYRILEVLTNLIGNAFKFTTKGYIKVLVEFVKAGEENQP